MHLHYIEFSFIKFLALNLNYGIGIENVLKYFNFKKSFKYSVAFPFLHDSCHFFLYDNDKNPSLFKLQFKKLFRNCIIMYNIKIINMYRPPVLIVVLRFFIIKRRYSSCQLCYKINSLKRNIKAMRKVKTM